MTFSRKEANAVWIQAKKDFYNPPLSSPVFKRPSNVYLVPGASIEISPPHYTLYVDLNIVPKWLPKKQQEEFLRNVYQHEIVHWSKIPYDKATARKLIMQVNKGLAREDVINYDASSVVFNMATDWIDDTYRLKVCGFKDLVIPQAKNCIKDVHKRIHEGEGVFSSFLRRFKGDVQRPSKLWQILVRDYELLWGTNLNVPDYDSNLDDFAKPLYKTLRNWKDENQWPKQFYDSAKILAPLFEEMLEKKRPDFKKEFEKGKTENIPLDLPPDLKEQMKTNPKKVYYKEKFEGKDVDVTDDSASNLPYEDFKRMLEVMERDKETDKKELEKLKAIEKQIEQIYSFRGCSCGYGDLVIKKRWHRERGYNLVKIREVMKHVGTDIPFSPKTWTPSDPVSDLDIYESISSTGSPLIPGITTKKWETAGEYGSIPTGVVPDLLGILDSSGSMNGEYEGSLFDIANDGISGATYYAYSKGARLAAINYSNVAVVQSWTNKLSDIETVYNIYQGGGTTFPINETIRLIEKNPQPLLTLAVTDTAIWNLDETISLMEEVLQNEKNQVAVFVIGGRISTKKFDKIGCEVHSVRSADELANKIIGRALKTYKVY